MLCHAAAGGDAKKVRELLHKNKVDVNAADYDKRTCLHLAASEGNLRIVEFLIENGADINFRDRWGGTALRDAVREGHHAVAAMVRQRGGELGLGEKETAGELCDLALCGCYRLDDGDDRNASRRLGVKGDL